MCTVRVRVCVRRKVGVLASAVAALHKWIKKHWLHAWLCSGMVDGDNNRETHLPAIVTMARVYVMVGDVYTQIFGATLPFTEVSSVCRPLVTVPDGILTHGCRTLVCVR